MQVGSLTLVPQVRERDFAHGDVHAFLNALAHRAGQQFRCRVHHLQILY